MDNLTKQEYDTLYEAMDAWVDKDAPSQIISNLVENLIPDEKVDRAVLEMRREQKLRTQAAARLERKKQATVLQAKLLTLRASAEE